MNTAEEIINNHFIHYFGSGWEKHYETFIATPSYKAIIKLIEHSQQRNIFLTDEEIENILIKHGIINGFTIHSNPTTAKKSLYSAIAEICNSQEKAVAIDFDRWRLFNGWVWHDMFQKYQNLEEHRKTVEQLFDIFQAEQKAKNK